MATKPSHPESSEDSRIRAQRDYVRYSGMGIEFALTFGLMGGLGWWLDGKLGMSEDFPLFLIIGIFAGMFIGIFRMKRTVDAMSRAKAARQSPSSDEDPNGTP